MTRQAKRTDPEDRRRQQYHKWLIEEERGWQRQQWHGAINEETEDCQPAASRRDLDSMGDEA